MKKAAALLLLTACAAPSWERAPHDQPYQRAPAPILHPSPEPRETYSWWNAASRGAIRPLGEMVSPAKYLELAAGAEEAQDINAFGQVIESPWFTPRLGKLPLSATDVARAGDQLSNPASGPWIVLGGKVEGATPGLLMQDLDGTTYVVKFDPPAFPELASGAEMIASKILWAAGYNVPETYLARCNLRWLQLPSSATTRGGYNETVPLDRHRLAAILAHVNPLPDGMVRALFSRVVPGRTLGPGTFRGVRSDDPNDRIPHEKRRSLRGLWLFEAWINGTDTRDSHLLDVFAPEEGDLGYVQHYLVDFGDSLGSGGTRTKYVGEGYEYRVDWAAIGFRFVTLGLNYPYWLAIRRTPLRSVGVFEADTFEPRRWRPNLPNPAFNQATALDTYWAASIIARFTPEMLESVVRRAEYREKGAEDWILKVLLARQKKVLEYAFEDVLPLDDPRMEGNYLVAFTDLALERELIEPKNARLSWTLRGDGIEARGESDQARIELQHAVSTAAEGTFLALEVTRFGRTSPSLTLHLRVLKDRLLPVALRR